VLDEHQNGLAVETYSDTRYVFGPFTEGMFFPTFGTSPSHIINLTPEGVILGYPLHITEGPQSLIIRLYKILEDPGLISIEEGVNGTQITTQVPNWDEGRSVIELVLNTAWEPGFKTGDVQFTSNIPYLVWIDAYGN
jgi:hypothetical protein